MHNSHRRAGATAAVLTLAAATAFSVSAGTASAASAPVPAPAAHAVPFPLSKPASFRRAALTTHPAFHIVSPDEGHLPFVSGPHGALSRSGLKGTLYSENWSGYAVDSGTYTSVLAYWTQPSADCPSGDTSAAWFWVGLDGFNSSTVEQTGTASDCTDGTASYGAWVETYPAGAEFYDATVEPGDQFGAYVTASGDSFTFYIEDFTQGWVGEYQPTVSGAALSSAEVIAEAPSSGGILPLTDFGTVNFTDATTDATGFGSLSPLQMDIENTSGGLEDTTSGLNGNDFSVTWDSE
jgi:Peptidase A4 family